MDHTKIRRIENTIIMMARTTTTPTTTTARYKIPSKIRWNNNSNTRPTLGTTNNNNNNNNSRGYYNRYEIHTHTHGTTENTQQSTTRTK